MPSAINQMRCPLPGVLAERLRAAGDAVSDRGAWPREGWARSAQAWSQEEPQPNALQGDKHNTRDHSLI